MLGDRLELGFSISSGKAPGTDAIPAEVYVVMIGIIHTCTALKYKPAFIATR